MPKISDQRLIARRRGIVQAATRCLQRNGLQGTGMRHLFRAANLSPGAVYRYFASKEELVAAVAAATPEIAEAALAATETAQGGAVRLRALLEVAAAGLPSAGLRFELQAAALRSPRVAAALRQRRDTARQALSEWLRWPADAAGHELVELILALCDGLARSRLLEPQADLDAQVAASARLLAAALALDRHADGVA